MRPTININDNIIDQDYIIGVTTIEIERRQWGVLLKFDVMTDSKLGSIPITTSIENTSDAVVRNFADDKIKATKQWKELSQKRELIIEDVFPSKPYQAPIFGQ